MKNDAAKIVSDADSIKNILEEVYGKASKMSGMVKWIVLR